MLKLRRKIELAINNIFQMFEWAGHQGAASLTATAKSHDALRPTLAGHQWKRSTWF